MYHKFLSLLDRELDSVSVWIYEYVQEQNLKKKKGISWTDDFF